MYPLSSDISGIFCKFPLLLEEIIKGINRSDATRESKLCLRIGEIKWVYNPRIQKTKTGAFPQVQV